ncbi:uncharacterized protein LOC9325858 [Arabidopsis lyrata subsp. lyrata]|uniref:uncharacterized protein LOC9325858 n=1 Tax=Arabidopsis lyrata subsp. lyrata TaxID=81972 RepID=UPI000A29EA9D|nr:uncharacterized protein LOC9325858 [Arabidopsis lyrata subsp. lyrata]|eukprot:XP_020867588.1 uncharacterized protein LOC9325858 [Arabidopsis lyrata subsp. lyrata]
MLSPFSSPRRSRRGSKENKNPYSNQGLDKFSALLSELDEKRQSIYAKRLDPDGPPLVRFVFTSSGECVPVMIKTKKAGQKKDVQDDFKVKKKDVLDDFKFKTESKTEHEIEIKKADLETEQQQSYVVNENLKKISRPNHLFPVTVVLVLIFLMFFGRTVSVMCTCIVWYLVPMIKEQSRNRGSTYETKKRKKLNIENRAAPDKSKTR